MLVTFQELKQTLRQVLVKHGFRESRADLCAEIFAANSRDGVHSHGLNRFPVFMDYLGQGVINRDAEPEVVRTHGVIEQWDGHLAPGMYTATLAMSRAVNISKESGMGCVAVRNTNHWMRGGTYGWQAAEKGCIAICGTNAIANMPPWGGTEPTIANNPLVIAVPRQSGHLVLDMAMSQFSYGKMNEYKLRNAPLPVPGGYNREGHLSTDPEEVMTSKRTLPVGFWKGSGLSLMMDVLVSCLSDGRTVKQITESGTEHGVSQFFLCLSPAHIDERIIDEIIGYAKSSAVAEGHSAVKYPGEQTLQQRKRSMESGIEVNDDIWRKVQAM